MCFNDASGKVKAMSQRMALFGGTFDPIHHGHLITARAVAEYFHFECITFVPAGQPPHKGPGDKTLAASADRVAMARLAIEGEGLFDVSDLEVARPPPRYTFDTLAERRQRHGLEVELCWIVGTDMLEDLPTWRRAGEVVDMARIITASRPPYSGRMDRILARLGDRFSPDQVSRLTGGIVQTPLIDITSTQIRRRIGAGKSARYLTPEKVVDYIHDRGLYAPRGPGRT